MAQRTVVSYYNTRKRLKDSVKEINDFKKAPNILESELKSTKTLHISDVTEDGKDSKSVQPVKLLPSVPESKPKKASKKDSARTKASKTAKVAKKGKTSQTTVTNFYSSADSTADKSQSCLSKVKNVLKKKQVKEDLTVLKGTSKSEEILKEQSEISQEKPANSDPVLQETLKSLVETTESNDSENVKVLENVETVIKSVQSPKRSLPIPIELTPSKKKPHLSPAKSGNASEVCTPKKDVSACRKLDMNFSSSPSKLSSSFHSPVKNQGSSPRKVLSPKEKLNALIDQSRSKLLLSPKLNELRKSLVDFSIKTSKLKEYHSNPYKITSVVAPSNAKNNTQALPSTPAHERFSYLAAPDESSLILPFKFRVLADMFRSMDAVVSILHNRKENITFDKVCEGVQKMLKRNFSKNHLGQVAAVLPSAYNFSIEKCSLMNKKTDSKNYQLVITPNFCDKDKKNKNSKPVAFQPMLPQCLIDRRADFNDALLKITKKHHQAFLMRINFPSVSEEKLKRWHPKFPVDSVSDIQPAQLPEPQENKIYSAKDVLNKVKGTFQNKVQKALQSVSDESKKDVTLELKDESKPKPEISNPALKGICTDLLEKIRARESAQLLETMTRTPEETKRLAMLERLPKIVNILWHYFIAERKTAVHIDVAVEKIIHSFNSLSTPDNVKDHLKLIIETFPGWLSLIEITKGVYVKIDKRRNINEMLDNFKH